MLLAAAFGIYLVLLGVVAYDDLKAGDDEFTLKA
jgi:hypothetical protein